MIYLASGQAALATSDQWLPILQRAIDDADGRWSAEQLLADVASGEVMVWVVEYDGAIKGVFTTRVFKSRITWVLVEDLAGEDMATWLLPAHRVLETWAREIGAEQIMLEGRRGWERTLRPLGYETKRVQSVKHLRTLQ